MPSVPITSQRSPAAWHHSRRWLPVLPSFAFSCLPACLPACWLGPAEPSVRSKRYGSGPVPVGRPSRIGVLVETRIEARVYYRGWARKCGPDKGSCRRRDGGG